MVRGTVNLPHGTGKTARVACSPTVKAEAAIAAGADIVGGDDLIEKVQGGFLDFDAAIATPDQMAKVGRSPGARPARPDAEPQDRHRHPRRPRPCRTSRAARSSSASTSTPTCTS
jgi:hypothetical protein